MYQTTTYGDEIYNIKAVMWRMEHMVQLFVQKEQQFVKLSVKVSAPLLLLLWLLIKRIHLLHHVVFVGKILAYSYYHILVK